MAWLDPRPLHDGDAYVRRYDNAWRDRRTAALPASVSRAILARAGQIEASGGNRSANLYVDRLSRELRLSAFALDHDAIRVKAEACAEHCRRLSLGAIAQLLDAHSVEVPEGPNVTDASRRRRYQAPDWWARKLRAHYARSAEESLRAAGLVARCVSPYVSAVGLAAYQIAQARAAAFIEGTDAVNVVSGQAVQLSHIAAGSLANPKIRRLELMTKISGLEAFATAHQHEWLFAVLTAPSRFHATNSSGEANPKFGGATVRDGQNYHKDNWARVRAALAKAKVVYYGLRTVEPHHDATPHWNLLLFAPPDQLRIIAGLVRDEWLADSPGEDGAQERRVKIKWGDARAGSAAAYVAKYIAKGTDAHSLGGDLESDAPDSEVALRNVAWARIHRVRQFQFFGSPRAGTWRELRRLRLPVEEPVIESVRITTDGEADYGAYLEAQRWIAGKRDAVRVTDYGSWPLDLNAAGRWVIKQTRWGEWPLPRTVGLMAPFEGEQLITRTEQWRLVNRALEAFVAGVLEAGLPWTRGNNCSAPALGDPAGWTAEENGTGPPGMDYWAEVMNDIDPMVGF